MTYRDLIGERLSGWQKEWFLPGMVVVQTDGGVFEVKNLDGGCPEGIRSIGCGGWDEQGRLEWVGLDVDVGHGRKSCSSPEDAVACARRVRDAVGGAAEVRRSKSGRGVHVRVRLVPGVVDGRHMAPRIAKWLAREFRVPADPGPLGRQNLWMWCERPGPGGFELVEECAGQWIVPCEALREETCGPLFHGRKRSLQAWSRATVQFIESGAPEGERNERLFAAACDLAGCGWGQCEVRALLLQPAVDSGLSRTEAQATIQSACSRPRRPARPVVQ